MDTEWFAAKNLDMVVDHELGGHKKHWDAVKLYYKDNSSRFSSIMDAKNELEADLRKYVKEQVVANPRYIEEVVSKNADKNREKSLNELIADGTVKGELKDPKLRKLIEEVISYDGNAK